MNRIDTAFAKLRTAGRTGDLVGSLRGHQDYVHGFAVLPDGSALVSASGDATLRVWDTAPMTVRLAGAGDRTAPPH